MGKLPDTASAAKSKVADAEFLFVTCQVGAEGAVKHELARDWPDFRFAYSRPGFLTFKLPPHHALPDDFDLRSVFARAYGFSLGAAAGDTPAKRAAAVWKLAGGRPYEQLHVWPRDVYRPGHRDFEPGLTAESEAADAALRDALARDEPRAARLLASAPPARAGELVLDTILVQPNQWWIGFHRAHDWHSTWPGGLSRIELPRDAVSRAYLKMEEALLWSRLPVGPGDRCAEIGSAPGGAAQALLNRGLHVTGIDPADIDPIVLAHPNFEHIKKRGADVRRREFRKTRWLFADINVAPNYTLDTIEAIVTHPEVHVRGLLLTLKLLDWKLAEEVPEYLQRVRGWGYRVVRARQLQHNRQEFCLAALRTRPRGG